MEARDPATGEPLADDAIQRILLVTNDVHVYQPPPLTSVKGHAAATWTADPSRHIFTARLRVVETASPGIRVAIVLEDPGNGQLFAAAPYTARSDVEPVTDSARFFALIVRDPHGRRATLGIGFPDRSDAFDLHMALREADRSLGLVVDPVAAAGTVAPRDYSLKEGETITVGGGRGRRVGQQQRGDEQAATATAAATKDLQSFALTPPPPPGAAARMKRQSLRDMGFDDGKFGEFA